MIQQLNHRSQVSGYLYFGSIITVNFLIIITSHVEFFYAIRDDTRLYQPLNGDSIERCTLYMVIECVYSSQVRFLTKSSFTILTSMVMR